MGAVEIHYLFLFSLCVFVLPQSSLCWGPITGFSQQSERRQNRVESLGSTWSGSGRSGQDLEWFSSLFQTHSDLLLCRDGNCRLVQESCAAHAAWRWASAAHTLYCTWFSWLQCTNSTERKQLSRLCFHTSIRASEFLFLAVKLPFISVYKDTSSLSFPTGISSPCWLSLALDKPVCCGERADWGEGPHFCASVVPLLP